MRIELRPWIAITIASLVVTVAAHADPTSVARAHSEAFAKACGAGDLPGVLALYEDNAIVVWPGQGEEATGKPAIEKLAAGLCTGKGDAPVLKSVEGRSLGKGYVLTYGRWEVSSAQPDGTRTVSIVRTTEVLKQTGGKWRYAADHASVGLPPPSAPAQTH